MVQPSAQLTSLIPSLPGGGVAEPLAPQNYLVGAPVFSAPEANLAIKTPVMCATTGAITLAGLQTIDGYATLAGDRVLVKNQADATKNGIYNAVAGGWQRANDAISSTQWNAGFSVFVANGTVNAAVQFCCTSANPIQLGVSNLTFGNVSISAISGIVYPPAPYVIGDILYASTTTAMARLADVAAGRLLVSGGVGAPPAWSATPTLGASGTLGSLTFGNATTGLVTVQPVTGALGAVTLSLPAATDTLTGKATTDIFTNKTFDTAATGNALKINGTAITAVTGTGSAVLANAPTMVAPALGAATHTSLTGPLIAGGSGAASSLTLESTSGVGTTDAIVFQTASQLERMRILSGGNIGIGTNTAANALLSVNANAVATTPQAGTIVQLVGPANTSATLEIEVYGASAPAPAFWGRAAKGTATTPAATGSGQFTFQLVGQGYDTGWAAGLGVIGIQASEAYSAGHNGTQIVFQTVPNATVVNATAVTIQASGGVSIGTANDPGIGGLLANTSIKSQGATAGIGYATGAGGTVAQATNKSTGVALNTVTGAITMNAATLNAATSVGFTLTNTAITATDVVVANIKSGATVDSYTLTVDTVAAGSCRFSLRNYTGGNLSEAVVINFAVIKGVTS